MSCRCVLTPEEQLESEIVYGPQQEIVVMGIQSQSLGTIMARAGCSILRPRSELPSRVMTFRT